MAVAFCPKSIRRNWLALFLLGPVGFLLVGTSLGWARSDSAQVLHIRVQGDVDTADMVREISDHLNSLAIKGYRGALLEFEPGRVREDLAWSLGAAMDDADRPVWVWLTGTPSQPTGPAQFELAVRAEGAWMDPRSAVAWEGPGKSEALRPDNLDSDRVSRERYSSLWVALERRGANTRIAEGLLRPSAPLRARWVVEGECELVEGPVEAGADSGLMTLVEPLANGQTRGEITPRVAVALGLIDGTERTARHVLRQAMGDAARGVRPVRVRVESQLHATIERAHGMIRRARAEEALAGDTLRKRVDRDVGQAAYDRAIRERAGETLRAIERGEAALRSFEALAAEHPEVLRTRAPVQANLPGVEESAARAWAREIEYVRRSLAGLRADAMAQATGSP